MLSDIDFKLFEELLKRESGLVVTPDKMYLLESRLIPIAKKWELDGLTGLAGKLRMSPDPALLKEVVEAMTTNETSFFRDNTPFDHFKKVMLPYILEKRAPTKRLRIWCAACSSGQEPYSLAMILKDHAAQLAGWNIEILATDLDENIMDQARAGIYTQFEVQRGLPINYLVQHFEQKDEKWHIKDDIKNMITIKKQNLLQNFIERGPFDIVFCRNVLIYFDVPTKADIMGRIHGVLAQDGFMVLGGAETVLGISDKFKPISEHRGLYLRDDTTNEIQAAG